MKISHYAIMESHHHRSVHWDELRDDASKPAYYIPFTKEDYIVSIKSHLESTHYAEIIKYCKNNNIKTIISLGAGRCILEYAIKTKSDLKVIVSDTSKSIDRIKSFNIFDDAIKTDYLHKDEIQADDTTMILLSRIDTEFDDENFRNLFQKLASNNIKHICFIPAELLDLKIFLAEMKTLLQSFILHKKKVFCGYARTKNEFYRSWKDYYHLAHEDLKKQLFFLT